MAPEQPERPKRIPPAPSLWSDIRDALVGRGVRPFSLWFAAVVLPSMVALLMTGPQAAALVAILWAWTVPYEFVANLVTDLGKVRQCLADTLPLLPGVLPYLPEMAVALGPNLHRALPAIGSLAPYLKYLMKYPAFMARALPILMQKIEIMIEYDMINLLGPNFEYMDQRHYDKLESILQDLVDDLEVLAPQFHIIAPHIVEISLRADRLFPVIHYILPYAEEMKDHIWWLVPFADVEGFEEFMPYLDKLAPHIDEFAPYGPKLLPYIGKMRRHIPIIIDNIDTLLPKLGEASEHMDPLVYWLSDLLPLANALGILRSKLLLSAGMPLVRSLPRVPAGEMLRPLNMTPEPAPGVQVPVSPRKLVTQRVIRIPKFHVYRETGVVYYVIHVNDCYAGEYRYSSLRKLDKFMSSSMGITKLPRFPGKLLFNSIESNRPNLEQRRAELQEYVQWVWSEPDIVSREEFIDFVQHHRKWHTS